MAAANSVKQEYNASKKENQIAGEIILNGEIATSSSVDKSASLEIPTQIKRAAEDNQNEFHKKPRLEKTLVQKDKERLAARLDGRKEKLVTTESIKCLSEDMSAERIAVIKAKRIKMKQSKIISDSEIGSGMLYRSFIDAEKEITQDIVNRERHGRTRKTILQSTGKSFAKDIFDILQSVEDCKTDGGILQQEKIPPTPMLNSQLNKPAIYNRYDQERFRGTEETEGFKINTLGTYHGMTLKSVTEGVMKTHIPEPVQLSMSGPISHPRPALKKSSKTPIIVIPATTTSLITMYNAMDILQDLKFVSTEDKKAQGYKRDNELLIQRQKGAGHTVPYKIIDNISKLIQDDWERVVAVFVQGPAWQFKGWPWGGNPVEIFERIRAFHLKWDDLNLDANVGKWNVDVIQLSHNKRHLDRANLRQIWGNLDKYMTKFKPNLRA